MTQILLVGAMGRMGRTIAQLAQQSENYRVVAGIDSQAGDSLGFPVFSSFQQFSDNYTEVDAIIDFSNPSLLGDLLAFGVERKLPIVVATTGLSREDLEKIQASSQNTAIFRSANMSLGINVMIELCKKASTSLGMDYDVEIIEKHHNKKVDSPSGTAIMLADAINEVNNDEYHYVFDRSQQRKPREKTEIGIHGVRGGNIVGDHEVLFIGEQEIVTISHSAVSRAVFGEGALKAAEYISGKEPGMYNMADLVKGAVG